MLTLPARRSLLPLVASFLFALLMVAAVGSTPASATFSTDTNYGKLTVMVTDALTGEGLEGAKVKIEGLKEGYVADDVTDGKGALLVTLQPDTYLVTVLADGYGNGSSEQVKIVAGASAQLHITLATTDK